MSQGLWIQIVESNVSDLKDLTLDPAFLNSASIAERSYVHAFLSTLQSDPEQMKEARALLRLSAASHEDKMVARRFVQLRSLYSYLKQTSGRNSLSLKRLEYVHQLFVREGKYLPKVFRCELTFLFADLYHRIERFETSLQLTRESVLLYREIGALKKSVRSELNLIVDRAHLDPSKSYLHELFPVLQKAKKVRDLVTVSSCYHSISHEYECVGAYRNALKAIDRAIAISFKFHYSNKVADYLAHKADLLVKMDRKIDAQSTFELLSSMNTPFAKKAIEHLRANHPWLLNWTQVARRAASQEKAGDTLPAVYWLDKKLVTAQAGSIEERLLSLLANGAKDKYELISALYGEVLPLEVTEPRLKSLIYRLRKRFPGLIRFHAQKYDLTPDLERAAK